MRGKEKNTLCRSPALRITPAYAGKRQQPLHANCLGKDHPRVCGEKTKKIP